MKMRIAEYVCKKCRRTAQNPFGSGSITITEEGETVSEWSKYRCPFCGSEDLEYESYIADVQTYNCSLGLEERNWMETTRKILQVEPSYVELMGQKREIHEDFDW